MIAASIGLTFKQYFSIPPVLFFLPLFDGLTSSTSQNARWGSVIVLLFLLNTVVKETESSVSPTIQKSMFHMCKKISLVRAS